MYRLTALSIISILSLFGFSTIASQAVQAQTYSVLYNFSGRADGYDPAAGVVIDNSGNLYGTEPYGGPEYGSAYRLERTSAGWAFSTLYYFGTAPLRRDGAGPLARVIIGPAGKLYGTASYGGGSGGFNNEGCGVVFDLTPPAPISASHSANWRETVIYTFTDLPDGCQPGEAGLVLDPSGVLYGTTQNGGLECPGVQGGCGTVFAITSQGESVLYRFAGGEDGAVPRGGVILDRAANLYGTTQYGGRQGYGTVYKLTPNGTEQVLYQFTGATDGAIPLGGLILDNSGNLYGTTSTGGSGGGGTVFKLSVSGTFAVIYSFLGDNGASYSLTMDTEGNLYGTTYSDGSFGSGMVFKLAPLANGSWIFTDLHDFGQAPDGSYPEGGVTLDRNGNLYGTTAAGGAHGLGIVWEVIQ